MLVAECNLSGLDLTSSEEARMPTLHVRNVPVRIYERIRRLATEENRSISAEIMTLLDRVLDLDRERRAQTHVLAGIAKLRGRVHLKRGAPTAVEMIRRDRDR